MFRLAVVLCSVAVGGVAVPASGQRIPYRSVSQPIPGIAVAGANDLSPAVTFDKRTLVFASDRRGGKGGLDLWLAGRTDLDSGWTSVRSPGDQVNSAATDTSPTLNTVGSQLWFASDRVGGQGATDLWLASRDCEDVPFGAPVPVVELNSSFVDDEPALAADELEVFFFSNRPGGPAGGGIWRATRATIDGRWNAPQPVRDLDGPGLERSPSLSRDGLTLFFVSDHPASQAGFDIWLTQRATRNAAFGSPTRVAELSTAAAESSVYTCYDSWTLFLTREVNGKSRLFASDLDAPVIEDLVEPALGDPWQVWVRADVGSIAVLCAAGRAGQAVQFPGIGGAFELDPFSLVVLHTGLCDRYEMSVAELSVPAVPALEGLDLHLQALVQAPTEGWFRRFTKRWKRRVRKVYDKWNHCKDERNRCFTKCRQNEPKEIELCARRNLYKLYWGPSAYAQAVWACAKEKLTTCVNCCMFDYARCMVR